MASRGVEMESGGDEVGCELSEGVGGVFIRGWGRNLEFFDIFFEFLEAATDTSTAS